MLSSSGALACGRLLTPFICNGCKKFSKARPTVLHVKLVRMQHDDDIHDHNISKEQLSPDEGIDHDEHIEYHTHGSHDHHHQEFKMNRNKLIVMTVMVFVVFVAELSVGFIANSLALLSDAFHMLSDFMSLIIGAVALQVNTTLN
jgi:hypothetical protein